MKKLLLTLAVLFAASAVLDTQARRRSRCATSVCEKPCDRPCEKSCDRPCATNGVSCPVVECMPTITHLGEEVYYVECTRPVMTYEKCLKAVRCEKSEICKSNPCEECLTPEEFSNKYGDKVVGPWKGQPGI